MISPNLLYILKMATKASNGGNEDGRHRPVENAFMYISFHVYGASAPGATATGLMGSNGRPCLP